MNRKKIFIIIIILFFVFPNIMFSWSWEKIYNLSAWDWGYDVKQTSDGGYIVVGSALDSIGYQYAILIKLGAYGNEEWNKMYGGASINPVGRSVDIISNGGFIVTGDKYLPAGHYDVYLLKADSSGDTNWTKSYGGGNNDIGYCVKQTSDGGYIIVGTTQSFGAGNYDVYLIKTDSSGNMSWYKTYGGGNEDRGYCIQQTSDGGYIISGYTASYGAGNGDVYLIKTDSAGNMSWYKTYGGGAADNGNSVQQTPDNGYIIAGYTSSFGAGGSDVYLIKTDSSGNMSWYKTYGSANNESGYSVDQTSDGGYIITGAFSDHVALIKTDSSGNTNWTKVLNTSYTYSYGQNVIQTTDNDYITVGYVCDASFVFSIYIAKYDPLNPDAPNHVFDIKVKNIDDNQESKQFSWTNISLFTQDWIISDQYYEISYLGFHSMITGWGLQVFTHNKDSGADPYYKGTGDPAGLIGTTYSNQVLNMAWMIKVSNNTPSKPLERWDYTGFSNMAWHYLLDKNSAGFTNELEYLVSWNQGGIAWHEAVRQNMPGKAYMYIAAKFDNLNESIYRTTQLRLEEYKNKQVKFLPRFFVYTNVWDDTNPVPNHYTPAWEEWSAGTVPTINFGYTGDYYSTGSCVRISFGSDSKGAVVWYDPGSSYLCPSGMGSGYDLTGATKLTFWVKGNGNYNNVIAQIGVAGDSCGVIENVDSGGDDKFNVTTSWTKHEIPLAGKDLRYISRGFKIGVWNPGANWIIYVDDIRYE